MTPKKPEPAFEVRFEGVGIYPERIPLQLLSKALAAIQRIAAGEIPQDAEEETHDHSIRLLGVKRGSAVYRCLAPSPNAAVSQLRLVGHLLETPEKADSLAYAFRAIDRLSEIAASLGCRITVRNPNNREDILATIERQTFETIAQEILVTGQTTITGRVERVGNATGIKCGLRLPTQPHQLICRVKNQNLARQLGDKLYENVVVSGEARWLRTNWFLVAFKIERVHEHKEATVDQMIRNLRRAGGKAWDRIDDPESYLREVTGES